uniref:site-specific DNA-methyltransferase (adenine-specific) n=1 Tax=Variovorax paradoxus (strain S110) TaxID=543728 RepID=C5CL47_VARPS
MTMQKIAVTAPEAQSANVTADNLAKLRQLFPELITEGPNGAEVNVNVLKALVGDRTAMDADEKYGLNWHGKRQARKLALTPSTGTLLPCPEDSVDWDTTQNLMIEGDNLEVLKLLQKSYAGKIKLIYIDPPYNTGKDFVYPDNFQDSIKNYLELTGQAEGGRKITSNTDASGRFHTDWLSMIYPRLKLASSLLCQEGHIFISIDDSEVANLRAVCNEVFGEENFVGCISWQKTYSPANDKKGIDAMHDYVVVYQRSDAARINLLPRTAKQDDAYTNPDDDHRGPWKAVDATRAEHRDYAFYPIQTPSGREVWPAQGRSWVFTKEEVPGLVAESRLWFGKDGSSKPSKKLFLTEVKQGVVPTTWWTHEDAGHNDEAKKELKALFTETLPFDTPKPTRLIQRILQIGTTGNGGEVVLDFFAGSGTTAQAVLTANLADKGNRRFVLVQLPEPTENKQFPTIANVTSERIRRVAADLRKKGSNGDTGFRSFKLGSSNIRAWNPDPAALDDSLFAHQDHLVENRTESDVLYELLIKLGLDLCVPIAQRVVAGKEIHSVGGGVLMACLAAHIEAAEVEAVAHGIATWRKELAPAGDTTCVFRDSAFADDVAKTNMAAILEQNGIATVRSL